MEGSLLPGVPNLSQIVFSIVFAIAYFQAEEADCNSGVV